MISAFPLIPRVRVNYGWADIVKALFTSDKSEVGRNETRKTLAAFFGVEDVLLTSSGRAGIYIILNYLPQKKVFIPAYTCMVVVEAALLAGKELHFVETSEENFNSNSYKDFDNDSIVLATHQYGLPCRIADIVRNAHDKGAVVIEDCAAAFGSRVDGKLVGTFGDFAAFSFDPSKLINVPNKAGFIIARNSAELNLIAEKTPVLNNDLSYKLNSLKEGCIYCILKNKIIYRVFHYLTMGRKGKMQLSEHDEPNCELDMYYTHGFAEWQSVFVNKQLKQINSIIGKRKDLFKRYHEQINNRLIQKPILDDNAVCIRFTISVDNKKDVYERCLSNGVDMGFSFNHIGTPKDWKKEHGIASRILNIPYYYNISEDEINKVVQVINSL